MTHDELLAKIDKIKPLNSPAWNMQNALRAVVELAIKQLETKNIPAEQVAWFNEGYNLAMDNIIDAIEKELR